MISVSLLDCVNPESVRDFDVLMRELNPDSSCDERKLSSAVSDGSSRIFIAREDGAGIVGTVTLCTTHTPEQTLGFVEAMVVLPQYRGRHIAWMLMEALIREARAEGVDKIHLTSRPQRTSANALYRKLGFNLRQTNVYEMVLN